jgi:ferrochelatase
LSEQTAVLLVNLGTPDNPTATSIRRFLKDFLWDKRVVEIPRALWWWILHGFVLPFRARKLVNTYRAVWLAEGSPLRVYTQKLAEALQTKLSNSEHSIIVLSAMTYGNPSVSEAINTILNKGIKTLVVLPLYPQASSSTTGAVFDRIAKELSTKRQIPSLIFIHEYCEEAAYLEGMAKQIETFWASKGTRNHLIFSFHGLPVRQILLGDAYQKQCITTASKIAKLLKIRENNWSIGFQSRFGKNEWIKPYTDKLLLDLAKSGVQSVDIFCPGFATDCLETLEELAILNRKYYLNAGGKAFRYIPAMNANDLHVEIFDKILKKFVQIAK